LVTPPTSTLFPYTTLFRSFFRLPGGVREQLGGVELLDRHAPKVVGLQLHGAHPCCNCRSFPLKWESNVLKYFWHEPSRSRPREGDRKSTRLNSSHVSISYA